MILDTVCPVCGTNIETFSKGFKCSRTLITDVAIAYLRFVHDKTGKFVIESGYKDVCNYAELSGERR